MLKSTIDLNHERERLLSCLNGYLKALRSHDFSKTRFAADLRNTENGQVLPLGTGLSRTIQSLRDGGHHFVDVLAGQVEYWGVADEFGNPAIVGIRLRVCGVLIDEIETLVVRGGGDYFFPNAVLGAPRDFHDVVPVAQRASRAGLIEAAQRYFDGIERQDGRIVAVTDNCHRLVNGAEDTLTDVSGMAKKEAHRALTVKKQITDGHYAYIEAIRERLFPLVDEERGLVVAHVIFDHPGDLKRADGMLPFKSPNSMLVYEAFKVKAGEIVAVWAIGGALPYGITSGWGPGVSRRIDFAA